MSIESAATKHVPYLLKFNELSFSKGDTLFVERIINEQWLLCVTEDQRRGLAPARYLCKASNLFIFQH